MKNIVKINKLTVGLIGLTLGIAIVLGIRFVTYTPPEEVHYHANFAVYVDGVQEQFDNPSLYEELSECSISTVKKPDSRAHLHGNIKDVVHVEDEAVTWGSFFQNIRWNVGDKYIDTNETLLVNTDMKKVTYILNGDTVDDVSNKVIGDKDKLLVSYGAETKEQLQKQFSTIATTAEKYDVSKDPASCGGNHSENGFKDRMKNVL